MGEAGRATGGRREARLTWGPAADGEGSGRAKGC